MYIRTKDGVYKVSKELNNGTYLVKGKWHIEKDKVITQSENLEKLCDGYYNDILGDSLFNFDGLYIYNDFESFKDDWIGYRTYDNWKGNGYGFIKTDKGLIYVAKMNDKGMLELIWAD